MNCGKLLALANMVLALGASIGYGVAGDYRMMLYWFFAAGITGTITL